MEKLDQDGRGSKQRHARDWQLNHSGAKMTPWLNEGFFADVVVLVEGEDDRAALLGTAYVLGVDFDAMGFAVLPDLNATRCSGNGANISQST